jgi:hypothetical protein
LDLATPATPGALRSVRVYPSLLDIQQLKGFLYAQVQNAKSNSGDGIFDSGLASHPNSALGVAQLTDDHGDSYVLIRPTRIGDLNLDGVVTISDFIDLASHFNGDGTWQEGDMNYDGKITISDFIDLASNFGGSYSGDSVPISVADQEALSIFASSIGASVPEPSGLLGVPLAAFICLRRYRRNKR